MGWRETWRATVESFLREVRAAEASDQPDPVVAAIAVARAELAGVDRELRTVAERHAHERAAAELCARRQEMADRIGDRETAEVAQRFRRRHEERAVLLRRKEAVLLDERTLAIAALEELLDYARVDATAVEEAPPTGDR